MVGRLNNLTLLALLSAACLLWVGGCAKKPEAVLSLASEFEPYVRLFEETSDSAGRSVRVTNLVVQWGDLRAARERANCVFRGEDTPVVTVDRSVWDRLSDSERKALLFHELGHCVCMRRHLDQLDGDGNPVSLMATYPIFKVIYESNEQTYDYELFQNGCDPSASI